MSVSVPTKTLNICKIHLYNDLRKYVKPPICSSSYYYSNSVELAYHKTGTSTLFGSNMKGLLSFACLILALIPGRRTAKNGLALTAHVLMRMRTIPQNL